MEVEATIPNSWVDEQNVRHIIVWDEDVEARYKLEDGEVVSEGTF